MKVIYSDTFKDDLMTEDHILEITQCSLTYVESDVTAIPKYSCKLREFYSIWDTDAQELKIRLELDESEQELLCNIGINKIIVYYNSLGGETKEAFWLTGDEVPGEIGLSLTMNRINVPLPEVRCDISTKLETDVMFLEGPGLDSGHNILFASPDKVASRSSFIKGLLQKSLTYEGIGHNWLDAAGKEVVNIVPTTREYTAITKLSITPNALSASSGRFEIQGYAEYIENGVLGIIELSSIPEIQLSIDTADRNCYTKTGNVIEYTSNPSTLNSRQFNITAKLSSYSYSTQKIETVSSSITLQQPSQGAVWEVNPGTIYNLSGSAYSVGDDALLLFESSAEDTREVIITIIGERTTALTKDKIEISGGEGYFTSEITIENSRGDLTTNNYTEAKIIVRVSPSQENLSYENCIPMINESPSPAEINVKVIDEGNYSFWCIQKSITEKLSLSSTSSSYTASGNTIRIENEIYSAAGWEHVLPGLKITLENYIDGKEYHYYIPSSGMSSYMAFVSKQDGDISEGESTLTIGVRALTDANPTTFDKNIDGLFTIFINSSTGAENDWRKALHMCSLTVNMVLGGAETTASFGGNYDLSLEGFEYRTFTVLANTNITVTVNPIVPNHLDELYVARIEGGVITEVAESLNIFTTDITEKTILGVVRKQFLTDCDYYCKQSIGFISLNDFATNKSYATAEVFSKYALSSKISLVNENIFISDKYSDTLRVWSNRDLKIGSQMFNKNYTQYSDLYSIHQTYDFTSNISHPRFPCTTKSTCKVTAKGNGAAANETVTLYLRGEDPQIDIAWGTDTNIYYFDATKSDNNTVSFYICSKYRLPSLSKEDDGSAGKSQVRSQMTYYSVPGSSTTEGGFSYTVIDHGTNTYKNGDMTTRSDYPYQTVAYGEDISTHPWYQYYITVKPESSNTSTSSSSRYLGYLQIISYIGAGAGQFAEEGSTLASLDLSSVLNVTPYYALNIHLYQRSASSGSSIYLDDTSFTGNLPSSGGTCYFDVVNNTGYPINKITPSSNSSGISSVYTVNNGTRIFADVRSILQDSDADTSSYMINGKSNITAFITTITTTRDIQISADVTFNSVSNQELSINKVQSGLNDFLVVNIDGTEYYAAGMTRDEGRESTIDIILESGKAQPYAFFGGTYTTADNKGEIRDGIEAGTVGTILSISSEMENILNYTPIYGTDNITVNIPANYTSSPITRTVTITNIPDAKDDNNYHRIIINFTQPTYKYTAGIYKDNGTDKVETAYFHSCGQCCGLWDSDFEESVNYNNLGILSNLFITDSPYSSLSMELTGMDSDIKLDYEISLFNLGSGGIGGDITLKPGESAYSITASLSGYGQNSEGVIRTGNLNILSGSSIIHSMPVKQGHCTLTLKDYNTNVIYHDLDSIGASKAPLLCGCYNNYADFFNSNAKVQVFLPEITRQEAWEVERSSINFDEDYITTTQGDWSVESPDNGLMSDYFDAYSVGYYGNANYTDATYFIECTYSAINKSDIYKTGVTMYIPLKIEYPIYDYKTSDGDSILTSSFEIGIYLKKTAADTPTLSMSDVNSVDIGTLKDTSVEFSYIANTPSIIISDCPTWLGCTIDTVAQSITATTLIDYVNTSSISEDIVLEAVYDNTIAATKTITRPATTLDTSTNLEKYSEDDSFYLIGSSGSEFTLTVATSTDWTASWNGSDGMILKDSDDKTVSYNGNGNESIIFSIPENATTSYKSFLIQVKINALTSLTSSISIYQEPADITLSISADTTTPGATDATVKITVDTNADSYTISPEASSEEMIQMYSNTDNGFYVVLEDNNTGSSRSVEVEVSASQGSNVVDKSIVLTQQALKDA